MAQVKATGKLLGYKYAVVDQKEWFSYFILLDGEVNKDTKLYKEPQIAKYSSNTEDYPKEKLVKDMPIELDLDIDITGNKKSKVLSIKPLR